MRTRPPPAAPRCDRPAARRRARGLLFRRQCRARARPERRRPPTAATPSSRPWSADVAPPTLANSPHLPQSTTRQKESSRDHTETKQLPGAVRILTPETSRMVGDSALGRRRATMTLAPGKAYHPAASLACELAFLLPRPAGRAQKKPPRTRLGGYSTANVRATYPGEYVRVRGFWQPGKRFAVWR